MRLFPWRSHDSDDPDDGAPAAMAAAPGVRRNGNRCATNKPLIRRTVFDVRSCERKPYWSSARGQTRLAAFRHAA